MFGTMRARGSVPHGGGVAERAIARHPGELRETRLTVVTARWWSSGSRTPTGAQPADGDAGGAGLPPATGRRAAGTMGLSIVSASLHLAAARVAILIARSRAADPDLPAPAIAPRSTVRGAGWTR
jgi:hypothetical protein